MVEIQIKGDESSTLSSSQSDEANSMMNTFDETFTKIISRTQKHNLSKPKFNKSIKHQTSSSDPSSPLAPRKSLSRSQFNSQKTLLNSLKIKKISRRRESREHDATVKVPKIQIHRIFWKNFHKKFSI